VEETFEESSIGGDAYEAFEEAKIEKYTAFPVRLGAGANNCQC
jgi:hypothetical protein